MLAILIAGDYFPGKVSKVETLAPADDTPESN